MLLPEVTFLMGQTHNFSSFSMDDELKMIKLSHFSVMVKV